MDHKHYRKIHDRQIANEVIQRLLNDGASFKVSADRGFDDMSKASVVITTFTFEERLNRDRIIAEVEQEFAGIETEKAIRDVRKILGFC